MVKHKNNEGILSVSSFLVFCCLSGLLSELFLNQYRSIKDMESAEVAVGRAITQWVNAWSIVPLIGSTLMVPIVIL